MWYVLSCLLQAYSYLSTNFWETYGVTKNGSGRLEGIILETMAWSLIILQRYLGQQDKAPSGCCVGLMIYLASSTGLIGYTDVGCGLLNNPSYRGNHTWHKACSDKHELQSVFLGADSLCLLTFITHTHAHTHAHMHTHTHFQRQTTYLPKLSF